MLSVVAGHAQSPPGINYQGIARNLDGKPLVLKDITIKINIVKDGDNGTVEYSETHSLQTNSFGLFTLVIGNGSVVTGDFRFISWAMGDKWLRVEMDPDGGNSFQLMGSQQFMSVPYAFYSRFSGNSLSPGQGISITNNVITNTGDADNNATNELNTNVTLGSDRILRITDGGGTREVDLSPLAASQTLGGVLTLGNNADGKVISNLGAPATSSDAATKGYIDGRISNIDQSGTNELQNVSLASNILTLSNSNTEVDLSPYLDNTDAQTLLLSGTSLGISGGNSVPLAPFMDNTDSQTLTFTGTTLAIQDGNSVDLSSLAAPQNLSFSGTTLAITGGNNINLSSLAVDAQNLSSSGAGTNRTINITNGTSTTIDVADNDNSVTNEIQDLSLNTSTNTLSLTSDVTSVNLALYLDNTDNQQLTLIANTLMLTNDATPVDLSPYLDDTDDQLLALSGTNLSITNGNSLSLAAFMDNTDSQDLTLTGNSLSLTGDPTPVNLAGYLDNTDNQNLTISGVGH
jgi:hypothetical protein